MDDVCRILTRSVPELPKNNPTIARLLNEALVWGVQCVTASGSPRNTVKNKFLFAFLKVYNELEHIVLVGTGRVAPFE